MLRAHHPMHTTSQRLQRGISLIESLVAIVVMALGILGILGVQMRTLADTQSGVRRAQAIRLIEDLSERIKSNPNALGNAASYATNWKATLVTPGTDCKIASGFPGTSCTSADMATYDKDRWLRTVRSNLPLGDAAVFVSATDPQQLGVMLAWRENERAREGDSTADTAAYKTVFTPASTGTSAVSCPAGSSCHLQYISLTQRCLPDSVTAGIVYCSE